MPDRNFVSRVRNRETGATLATFVHVDTTPLVGMYDSHPENSKMAQNLLELEKEADGMKWLSATLARLAGEEGFTFVVGHHPVRSGYFSEDAVKQVRPGRRSIEMLAKTFDYQNVSHPTTINSFTIGRSQIS
jgi:hypothetical protein